MNVKKCVRALLCLYLTLIIAMDAVKAQTLKVGDTLPPELWSMPLDVINHPESKDCITLADYKDKLIILDFWATWCAPCIAMLPKQDSLQKQFKDQLQILPVTYQTGEEVSTFMEKYEKRKGVKNSLPKVINNQSLKPYFEHNTLPHYVWISANGKIVAITGNEQIKGENILSFISKENKALTTKQDPKMVAHDKNEPLFINGNGGDGKTLIHHSLLTSYSPGLSGNYMLSQLDSVKGIKVTATNLSLLDLFKYAYGERFWIINDNNMILDVKDSNQWVTNLKGQPFREWMMAGKGFCYELIVPPSHAGQLFEIMRRDLVFYFPDVKANVKKQLRTVYALTKVKDIESLYSKDEAPLFRNNQFQYFSVNYPLGSLLKMLNGKFLHKSPYPLIDETGIKGGVNISLDANMSDIDDLNRALEKYGLTFILKDSVIDILAIQER